MPVMAVRDDFQPASSIFRSMWKINSITAQRSTAASILSRIVMIPFGTCMKSMMIIDDEDGAWMTIRTFSTGADRGNAQRVSCGLLRDRSVQKERGCHQDCTDYNSCGCECEE